MGRVGIGGGEGARPPPPQPGDLPVLTGRWTAAIVSKMWRSHLFPLVGGDVPPPTPPTLRPITADAI